MGTSIPEQSVAIVKFESDIGLRLMEILFLSTGLPCMSLMSMAFCSVFYPMRVLRFSDVAQFIVTVVRYHFLNTKSITAK